MAGSGMVKRHLTYREPGWRRKCAINGFAAVLSAIVVAIFAITKFTEGAWLVVVLFPSSCSWPSGCTSSTPRRPRCSRRRPSAAAAPRCGATWSSCSSTASTWPPPGRSATPDAHPRRPGAVHFELDPAVTAAPKSDAVSASPASRSTSSSAPADGWRGPRSARGRRRRHGRHRVHGPSPKAPLQHRLGAPAPRPDRGPDLGSREPGPPTSA